MVIETKRLIITTASQVEMIRFIEAQTDEILIKAYREMLQGCLDHPDHWEWYAIWFIKTKYGSHIGDLSFKGLNEDGAVEIGYGISEINQGNGYATEAVNAVVTWALKQPGVLRGSSRGSYVWRPRQNLITERHKEYLKNAALSRRELLVKKGLVFTKLVDIFRFIHLNG